jgi:hypothetical protein
VRSPYQQRLTERKGTLWLAYGAAMALQNQSRLTITSVHNKLDSSKNHQLINSSTQKLINLKLKILSFILQYHLNFRTVLAKMEAKK